MPLLPLSSRRRRAALAWLALALAAPAAAQVASGTIAGVVRDASGRPVAGMPLELNDPEGVTGRFTTDSEGRFHVELRPGVYHLQVTGAAPAAAALHLGPGARLRALVTTVDGGAAPVVDVIALTPGVSSTWDAGALADLPLDRTDPARALLDLSPGIARGAAFGSAAEIGSPRRIDGIDLSDPLDGRAWAAAILPAARLATVRVGVGADEPDGSGAVVDIVTGAGGTTRHGTIDLQAAGSSWARERLPDTTLTANPSLAARELPGRSIRAAVAVSGPLGPRVGLGLAFEHADLKAGGGSGAVSRTPRAHGRMSWASGERTAGVVGYVERRSIAGDVPASLRGRAAPGLDNRHTSRTAAGRGTWQGPVGGVRASASVDLLRGSRATTPSGGAPAREDDVTGLVSGSLGLVRHGDRTRLRAGAALDWATARAGGHELRAGGAFERAGVVERASFLGGEYFHDLAGRPDTVDTWAGVRRDTRLSRTAAFVSDTWRPARRLSVVAGLRMARMAGGEGYGTTAWQPRASAALGLGRGERLLLRGHAGVVGDPLYASHVDRTVGGDTPLVTSRILPGGGRVEIERTAPTMARVAAGIRHPQVREASGGLDFRLARGLEAGATVVVRRFVHAIDATLPGARWLPLVRTGLGTRPITIYRWIDPRSPAAATIANVDGLAYLGADGQPIGIAAATRDYSGVVARVQATLPDGRGALSVAFVSAVNRGTLDDTHESGIQRSDRFASPTASLTNVDGDATMTPASELTIAGTIRLPRVPVRMSAIYLRQTGRRYAATRTFTAGSLGGFFDADGRTALLERRGGRTLPTVDDLSLRVTTAVPGSRRVEIYADVYNVLGRAAVTAVETGAPLGSTSGTARAFETPLEVQPPLRILVGGRFRF